MIKAILFDMDGVLIDAREWHYRALNMALAHFGFNITEEAHLTTFDGLPTRKKLEMLSQIRGLPHGLHSVINSMKQKYTVQIAYDKCRPTFNHLATLANLKQRGFSLAVCSNSIRPTVLNLMELSSLDQYLDLMLSNNDVTNPKPDPEIYLKAIDFFNLRAEECLIIEDNEHGLKAAYASGASVMKVADPSQVTLDRINPWLEK
jgi:beta-phosphoglucomutase